MTHSPPEPEDNTDVIDLGLIGTPGSILEYLFNKNMKNFSAELMKIVFPLLL